jgi:hypothetical protein
MSWRITHSDESRTFERFDFDNGDYVNVCEALPTVDGRNGYRWQAFLSGSTKYARRGYTKTRQEAKRVGLDVARRL